MEVYPRRQSASALEFGPDSELQKRLNHRHYRSNNERCVMECFPKEQILLPPSDVSPRFIRRHSARPFPNDLHLSSPSTMLPHIRLPPPTQGANKRHSVLSKTRFRCAYQSPFTPTNIEGNEGSVTTEPIIENSLPHTVVQQNHISQQTGMLHLQQKLLTDEQNKSHLFLMSHENQTKHFVNTQPLSQIPAFFSDPHNFLDQQTSSNNTFMGKLEETLNKTEPMKHNLSNTKAITYHQLNPHELQCPDYGLKATVMNLKSDKVEKTTESYLLKKSSLQMETHDKQQGEIINYQSPWKEKKYCSGTDKTLFPRSYKTLEELASEIHPRKVVCEEEKQIDILQSSLMNEANENLGFEDDSSKFEKICQSSRSHLLSEYQTLSSYRQSIITSKNNSHVENKDSKIILSSEKNETEVQKKTEGTENIEQSIPSLTHSPNKISTRQDSSISSDSFSQTSSPSYTTKTLETPLLPHHGSTAKSCFISKKSPGKCNSGVRLPDNLIFDHSKATSGNKAMTKSISTPASLQAFVKYQQGPNISLQHRIIHDMNEQPKRFFNIDIQHFHLAQVVFNVILLVIIAGVLTAYFKVYPETMETIRYINRTINTTTVVAVQIREDINPVPGVCVPVIIGFCHSNHLPYNFTMFPNYFGHFSQLHAKQDIMMYDILIDVRCFELTALFLCTLFVPKCGPTGNLIRPCKELCTETIRRCGFFFGVFDLDLPDYIACDLFPEYSSIGNDSCTGYEEVMEVLTREKQYECKSGFTCDVKRCIPSDWRCDGHIDCIDQTDESDCNNCEKGMIHCGGKRCLSQKHMCDGVMDCPWGQDERNCIRLSDRMGDDGFGQLQIFHPTKHTWQPACVSQWNSATSPEAICSSLGYSAANWSYVTITGNASYSSSKVPVKEYEKPGSLLKTLRNCPDVYNPTVNISCLSHTCGVRKRTGFYKRPRIIGGKESTPGDWPFLAALLGGPDEIFYCAGVLIADQWVLSASHCVGNSSMVHLSDYTIHLGITRRHAHTYFSQKMKIRRIIVHPDYDGGSVHDNDVALFQLKSRVTFHQSLLPVCLPESDKNLIPGTKCTVIGWGKKQDREDVRYESALHEVEVPIIDRDLCNSWLVKRDLSITDGMMCAGYPEGGKDACQGDSGGPLLCRQNSEKEIWYVAGIVSWGVKCAHPQLPGIYANVPHYVNWIKEQMMKYNIYY